MKDLLYLMQRLRDPKDGCPWDLEQDFKSLRQYSLEEVYELVQAINLNDHDNLKEELGDLLFHITFYAQIAQEKNLFKFDDVVQTVVEKLVRRHPHVFPEGTLKSRRDPSLPKWTHDQINTMWSEVKAKEKLSLNSKSIKPKSQLDILKQGLPALKYAQDMQKLASKTGFDWTELNDVISNLEGEILELKEAIASKDEDHIEDELGDVLYSVVNVARHLNKDAEASLTRASTKFRLRFEQVEVLAEDQNLNLKELELTQLDLLWNEAKNRI
ncbi:nucleoside triphosphate pyrophosphohydrolase [Marinicellulosiphila megalodicopiae]|uniref:nucleoside triphosphate pyrophosphohydrolase n=1 Tax=Marinicellulosiphila megalodicopiae TaxID=2724896 RepID=UPI003BAF5320